MVGFLTVDSIGQKEESKDYQLARGMAATMNLLSRHKEVGKILEKQILYSD